MTAFTQPLYGGPQTYPETLAAMSGAVPPPPGLRTIRMVQGAIPPEINEKYMALKRTLAKDNLTMEQLLHSIDAGKYPKMRKEAGRLLAGAKDKCKFVKVHRNKRIAHNDLRHKLQAKVNPLPSPAETNIEEALESIRNVMNTVPRRFHTSEIAAVNYYHLVTRPGDGTKIISRLREAEAFRKQRPE